MAMPLAIEPPIATVRNPRATGAKPRRAAGGDRMSGRPPIPRGVVTWPDDALPAGAGDPAVAIDGPPSFIVLHEAARPEPRRQRVETALFGAMLAAVLGVTALGFAGVAKTIVAAEFAQERAVVSRAAVVETKLLSVERAGESPSRSAAAKSTQAGS